MKICIFVFSGTGMTRYVINKLSPEFEKQQAQCDFYDVENTTASDVSISGYDMVGIAYPVHSFNAPKIVIDFIKKLPPGNGLDTFIVCTAGEYSRLNFASSRLLIKLLRNKGYNIFYDRQIEMPSNFIVRDDDDTVRRKLQKACSDIPTVADEIHNRVQNKIKAGVLIRLVAFLGRAEWLGTNWIGKYIYADRNCDFCGLCVDKCPNRNISYENEIIKFNKKCGLCMRCFYICPNRAIKIRKPFKSLVFEKWYEDFVK